MYVLPPLKSLDVTRTHLEMNRLGNLWLKNNTLTNLTESRSAVQVTEAHGGGISMRKRGACIREETCMREET